MKEAVGDFKLNNKQMLKDNVIKTEPDTCLNLIDDKNDMFNVYVLRKPLYVVDELFLNIYTYEYDIESKPIPLSNLDTST